MSYRRFAVYNVAGGTAWILLFLLAGWWFGGLRVVQKNFHLVIVAIIVISVLPGVVRVRCGRGAIARSPQPSWRSPSDACGLDRRLPMPERSRRFNLIVSIEGLLEIVESDRIEPAAQQGRELEARPGLRSDLSPSVIMLR